MPKNRQSAPRLGRAAASAAGAFVLLVSLAGPAVASERATFRLLGSSPIYANAIDVHKAGGGSVHVRPARYHYRITTEATATSPALTTEASGNCVDLSHYIVTGRDYQVDLQSAADAPELGSPSFLAAGWLLSQTDAFIAAAADPGLEAGALQVAVWQLSGQARELDAPSSDAAVNARVAELRALSAGKSVSPALDVTVPGGETCIDTAVEVKVTGTPGAVVDLSIPTAPGATPTARVEPAQLTIDADGVREAMLTSTVGGPVTVTATTAAPTLLRATKTLGASTPQDQLFLKPGTVSDEATQNFNAECGLFLFGPALPPAGAPLAPLVPLAPPAPPLALSLDSPRLAAPGGDSVYTLRVTNNGPRTARGLRVAQRLGVGVSPVSARGPKGTSTRFGRRAAHWTLAALKSGRSATLVLRVHVAHRLAGDVAQTTAVLRGAGSAGAKASATTLVVRKVGKTEQGF